KILAFVQLRSTSLQDALDKLDALGGGPEVMEQGRAELKEVLGLIHAFGVPETHYALNLSIASGFPARRTHGSGPALPCVRRAGNPLRAEPVDRSRPRLLHRHGLRDHA